nr:MAG TPA: hypothetical protein [Caudoviricetes sp.]
MILYSNSKGTSKNKQPELPAKLERGFEEWKKHINILRLITAITSILQTTCFTKSL